MHVSLTKPCAWTWSTRLIHTLLNCPLNFKNSQIHNHRMRFTFFQRAVAKPWFSLDKRWRRDPKPQIPKGTKRIRRCFHSDSFVTTRDIRVFELFGIEKLFLKLSSEIRLLLQTNSACVVGVCSFFFFF